ncbi:MAG: ABC transporter substrate-binding protein [Methanobacteriota archaeon]
MLLAVLLVVTALGVMTTYAQAAPNGPQPRATGPNLDEMVWSEETDPSKALTELIAGNHDIFMFDIRSAADKERAAASDQVNTFFVSGLFDELSMNPAEQNQTAGHPRNPFFVREVREAMQYLVDRDFIVRDIYGGFATPFATTWHPKSADYGRAIADLLKLEDRFAFNPEKGKSQITTALQSRGWTIQSGTDARGTDCPIAGGCWRDPENRIPTIRILKRTQDERLQLGAYYGNILRGLNFRVEETGVRNAAIPYGSAPNEDIWHIYTAGWIATSLTAYDDGQLQFYAACGIGEPYCTPGGPFYDPPDELEDIANTLLLGQYKSSAERQSLIARGTELAMNESLRIFIDARNAPFVHNTRMSKLVWDLFGGPTHPWGLKTATVPADPTSGLRTAKVLNFQMFVDGWNPWVFPGWLYDGIQRDQFMDPAMSPHPHTGRWTDYRTNATVLTAGPDATLPVPVDAVVFNTTTNTWTPLGTGVQAVSRVTYDHVFGKWHHGPDITMDDVLYTWSNLWRRAAGDIGSVTGISNAASPATEAFVQDSLKAIRVVDADTLEVYFDFWHVDPQEIAGFASTFPDAPWEVQEIAAKLILDGVAANHDADAGTTGRIWLDLTKGDSLPFLAAALATYSASNWIPPGMAGEITAAEATARWSALEAWALTRGHYWPSQGPFYLETVDTANRQTIMKAFRTGYPFDQTYWNALVPVDFPSVNFQSTPPVVFAGTPAIFDFTITLGPQPTDDLASAVWFLRDASTGQFLKDAQNRDARSPTRLGTGSYRIEVPDTETDALLLGNFEVISVVSTNAVAVPAIRRVSFLILPSTEWFEALLDARASLIENDVDDLSGDIGQVQTDLNGLASSTSGLVGLVTAMAILAVIAVVISVVSVALVLRRARPPAIPKDELTEP